MNSIPALCIARYLAKELTCRPFSGKVTGTFHSTCNMTDVEGRVIALTVSAAKQGPFSILVPEYPGLFASLSLHKPVTADRQRLRLGRWAIDVGPARLWEAQIHGPAGPIRLTPAVVAVLQPYAAWPVLTNDSPSVRATARLARAAAARLRRALQQADQAGQVSAAASLAGLGSGLTPAGDDYLVGVMAALWFTGQTAGLAGLAQAASRRTTALSAAFLRAAARGEFLQPWHRLAPALWAGDAVAVAEAAGQLVQIGASSGRDALAGFVMSLFCLPGVEQFTSN